MLCGCGQPGASVAVEVAPSCAVDGQGRGVAHPRVVRGVVMQPRAAAPGAVLEDQPAAGASVSIVALVAGARSGEALVVTQADERGRWCAVLPEGRAFEGMRLMAVGQVDGVALRQPMPYASEGRVDLAGEALVRGVLAQGVAIEAVAPQTYQNWRTIAGTTLSLWRDEGAEALRGEALVARAVEALAREPRLADRWKGRAKVSP